MVIGSVTLMACMVALVSVGFAFLWSRWPWAVVAGFILLTLLAFISTIRTGRFETSLLCADAVVPVPSMEAEFHGIYTPHWEVPHVRVLTGWRLFGLLPHFEAWLPLGGAFRNIADYHIGSSPAFVVHFRGVPSETGHFGHMGSARREVQVVALLDSFTMPKQPQLWT